MGKILFFVFAAVGIYVLLGWLARLTIASKARRPEERTPQAAVETMVSCNFCGINVPASEAVRDGEQVFCSEEHRRGGRTA